MTREEGKSILLESLLDGPKVFHSGRCPVLDAIDLVFEMASEGLVSFIENKIAITQRGKDYLGAGAGVDDSSS